MDKLHEESRKQFEEAYAKAKHFTDNEDWAWQFWQASRANIVVELPSTEGFGHSEETASVMRDGCAEAIEEAGIKWSMR